MENTPNMIGDNLRTTSGALAPLVDRVNQLQRIINNLSAGGALVSDSYGDRIKIQGRRQPYRGPFFGYVTESTATEGYDTINITNGYVSYGGVQSEAFTQTNSLALTGTADLYVYISFTFDGDRVATGTVKSSTTYPALNEGGELTRVIGYATMYADAADASEEKILHWQQYQHGHIDFGNPLSIWAFGPTLDTDTGNVTLTAGSVYHGERTAVSPSVVSALTVTGTQTIYCKYEWATNAASVGIVATASMPTTDNAAFYKALHDWDQDAGGTVFLVKIRHLGDIQIPGAFA